MAPDIGDCGLIGDCETAAIIDRQGTVVWLCWPRLDSEACFASLLGGAENGHWRIAPLDGAARFSRRYQGDTLILETEVETASGVVRLIDFMPVRGEASDVIRIVVGVAGAVEMRCELSPRFDYGRLRPRWRGGENGCAYAVLGPHALRLTADTPVEWSEDGDCTATFTVAAGETRAFVLTYYGSLAKPPDPVDPHAALDGTRAFWADWCGRCTYRGPWRDAVVRSLIVMKALTYRPSGAIAAAVTSSLPEISGGACNWDYRYCWLRDATFTLLAFLRAGFDREAKDWRDWLTRTLSGDPKTIQPVYGLGGETRLTEWSADWLCGFGGAQPVRFGNDAFQQRQLDACGEVVDALHHAAAHGLPPDAEAWRLTLKLVQHIEAVWREPGEGIWEGRGPKKRYTYSQVMAWAALDRVIQRARDSSGAPPDRWLELRAQIHHEVCDQGFHRASGGFVRDFGSDQPDASLLLLPQIGFLPSDDPRIAGTIAAVERHLVRDGFVYRTPIAPDAKDRQGAFLACCFWYADALAMVGRRADAERMFERVLSVRSDLGLLSEEYDPRTGALLGNVPQALSHLALVNTAFRLFQPEEPRGQGVSERTRQR